MSDATIEYNETRRMQTAFLAADKAKQSCTTVILKIKRKIRKLSDEINIIHVYKYGSSNTDTIEFSQFAAQI